jgi:hypothetical protein
MRLRRTRRYFATFTHGGETVDVPVRARNRPEAERRAKMLVAEGWKTTLVQVRRESWLERRARSSAPTAGERERRSFTVALLAGAFFIVAAVFVAAQASGVVA